MIRNIEEKGVTPRTNDPNTANINNTNPIIFNIPIEEDFI